MCTTFNGVDVVDIRIKMLIITVVVSKCYFYRNIGLFISAFEIKHFGNKCIAPGIAIQHFYKFADAAFAVKTIVVSITRIIFFSQVVKGDAYATIEIS